MTKFCTNCGKELDENAAICLNCGVVVGNTTNNTINNSTKKEKKKGLPTWAIVLIVVGCIILIPVILLIVFSVFTYSVISDADFEVEDYIEQTVTQKGTLGDTLVTEEFKITLTNASVYDSIEGEDIYKPTAGKEYLVLFLDIENISNETQYIHIFDFNGYVDGYTVSQENLYVTIEGMEEIGTKLLPGKKTKGYIAFKVDTSWQEFNLHYSSWYEEIEFLITNKDVSAGANYDM